MINSLALFQRNTQCCLSYDVNGVFFYKLSNCCEAHVWNRWVTCFFLWRSLLLPESHHHTHRRKEAQKSEQFCRGWLLLSYHIIHVQDDWFIGHGLNLSRKGERPHPPRLMAARSSTPLRSHWAPGRTQGAADTLLLLLLEGWRLIIQSLLDGRREKNPR